ncbi:aminoglycoside phosphotransferase family protein [Aquihabitans sp. McL0605]|uniref:aminoglycoside phosphotransferase family protein n=1 Tax=Aquihabitans sp. McL0605 TaxID=3415671 RepID=UPI003CFB5F99
MEIPANLRWLRDRDDGRAWLALLGDRVRHAAETWQLELGPAFAGAHVSYACAARTPDGTEVVLKVQYPHEDCRTEAEALAAWDGRGAVRLLAHDAERWTLLLERCRPGTDLGRSPLDADATIDVMADLTEASWIVPPAGHTLATLQDQAHRWLAAMEPTWEERGRPFPRARLDLAMAGLREVADDQGPQVIINQDLHEQNVLAAERAPWLVIDPKPLVGERALSLAPILRSLGYFHGPTAALAALDPVAERLGLDVGRVLRWTVGQSVAWGMDPSSTIDPRQAETVDRLAERLRSTS